MSRLGATIIIMPVLFSLIYQILGLAIFCVGVWLVYLQEEADYDVITGSTIVSGAALLVLAGGVTLVVSAVGIVGAYGMWRPVLVIVSEPKEWMLLFTVYSQGLQCVYF